MTKKEQIKHFFIRANAIDAMGAWTESVEDAYWKLKEDMFKAERLWELENPVFYWAQEMKDSIYAVGDILDSIWRKQFA